MTSSVQLSSSKHYRALHGAIARVDTHSRTPCPRAPRMARLLSPLPALQTESASDKHANRTQLEGLSHTRRNGSGHTGKKTIKDMKKENGSALENLRSRSEESIQSKRHVGRESQRGDCLLGRTFSSFLPLGIPSSRETNSPVNNNTIHPTRE